MSPFPVESSLLTQLNEHINAEIVTKRIKCQNDIIDYLTWTFLYRRILLNPSYYGIQDTSTKGIYQFLNQIIQQVLEKLLLWKCIIIKQPSSSSKNIMHDETTHETTQSMPRVLGLSKKEEKEEEVEEEEGTEPQEIERTNHKKSKISNNNSKKNKAKIIPS